MGDQQSKDLMEIIYEMNSRLARIEERLTRFDKVEDRAETAHDIANKALLATEENRRSIDGIRKAMYWGFGFIITIAISLILEFIKK